MLNDYALSIMESEIGAGKVNSGFLIKAGYLWWIWIPSIRSP